MFTSRHSSFVIRHLAPDAQHSAFSVRHWSLVIGHWSFISGLLLLLSFGAPRAAADASSDAETRLRDTLRSTMLQLRDAQNQIATLQGTQADSDAKNKELTDQLALLKKHSIDDKAAADTTIGALTAKAADQGAEIAKIKDLLGKWQAAYRQVRDDAGVAEAERAKLADDKLVLQRRVDYLEAKNVALFSLGNEILGRYEDFSLGNALSEKEPFIGVTRVKLENLVQDYQDKLLDQRATPAP
jgi:chromosome segregation ATPase